MTLVKSGTLGSGTPLLAYELHAEQTGGSGNQRTIKVTLKAKCNGSTSASWYGYATYYQFTINGVKTTTNTLKSTEKWYGSEGYRTFTTTVTTDVGTTSSKAITIGVTTSSNGGWTGSASGSFTVGSTNTAPTWVSGGKVTIRQTNSSGAIINGTNNGKFPENVSALYISWDGATDKEGNTITYEVFEAVNGVWSLLGTTTNKYYSRTIPSGANTQGYTYGYYIQARDSGGLYASGQQNGNGVQKNSLNGASASCSSMIGYSTTSFDVAISGASNTNGNTSFTYFVFSNDIAIYNQSWLSSTTQNIKVWRTGETVPTTPYIKFDELKTLLASSSYKKSVTFYVQTKNAYGSIVTKSFTISFNIQTTPSTFSFGSVSGTTIVNDTAYLIPSEKALTLTWGASTDALGTGIKYDLYYSYNNGSSYTLIKSDLTENKFVGSFPTVTSQTSAKFKVIAKTAYGTTRSVESTTYTLHYVGVPTIKLSLVRNQSNYTITGTVTVNTSIGNINLKSVKYTANGVTTQTAVSTSGKTFTLTRNLAEGSTDNVTFYVLDVANSDLGKSATTIKQTVGRYNPMFSIREKGVGVNCINTGSLGAKLRVNGNTIIATSAMPSSGQALLDVDTTHDNNAMGNGKTLLGYNSGGKYYNYFRGSGMTYVDTLDGMRVKGETTIQAKTTISNGGLDVQKGYFELGAYSSSYGTDRLRTFYDSNNKIWNIRRVQTDGVAGYAGIHLGMETADSKVTAHTFRGVNVDITNYLIAKGTQLTRTGGGNILELKRTDGTNNAHNYITWYSQDNVRRAWLGIGGGSNNNFGLAVEDGSITVDTKTGIFMSTKGSDGTTGHNVFRSFSASNTQVLTAVGGGNGGTLIGTNAGKVMTNFFPYDGASSYTNASKSTIVYAGQYVQLAWDMDNNSGNFNSACSVFGYGQSFLPSKNNAITLGNTAFRWSTIYSVNALSTSDSSYKENIKLISDNEEGIMPLSETDNQEPTVQEIYDFVKDTNLYSFDYKDMEVGASQYGLLADELLESDSKVKDRIVYATDKGAMVSTQSYASTLHIALQKAMEKIEILENKVEKLEGEKQQ